MVKTSQNRNSVKIVLDFTGFFRLLGNNSVIPFLTAAEKRHFHPPKLPALRAEVDGLAQKSVRPFSCFLAAFSPQRPKSLDFDRFQRFPAFTASGFSHCRSCQYEHFSPTLPHVGATSGFQASGGDARLCPESRTNRRHGRDRLGLALWLCVQSVFSIKSAYFLLAASSSSCCICRSYSC